MGDLYLDMFVFGVFGFGYFVEIVYLFVGLFFIDDDIGGVFEIMFVDYDIVGDREVQFVFCLGLVQLGVFVGGVIVIIGQVFCYCGFVQMVWQGGVVG